MEYLLELEMINDLQVDPETLKNIISFYYTTNFYHRQRNGYCYSNDEK